MTPGKYWWALLLVMLRLPTLVKTAWKPGPRMGFSSYSLLLLCESWYLWVGTQATVHTWGWESWEAALESCFSPSILVTSGGKTWIVSTFTCYATSPVLTEELKLHEEHNSFVFLRGKVQVLTRRLSTYCLRRYGKETTLFSATRSLCYLP